MMWQRVAYQKLFARSTNRFEQCGRTSRVHFAKVSNRMVYLAKNIAPMNLQETDMEKQKAEETSEISVCQCTDCGASQGQGSRRVGIR